MGAGGRSRSWTRARGWRGRWAAPLAVVALVGCAPSTGAPAGQDAATGEPDAATGGPDTATEGDADPLPEPDADLGAPPPEEPGATEGPGPPGPDRIALEVGGLPIGGAPSSVTSTHQCVDVVWSTPPDLPAGIEVTVEAVTFVPDGAFRETDASCAGGHPRCQRQLPLSTTVPCTIALAWVGDAATDGGELRFSAGVIRCPAGDEARCEAFRAEVEARDPKGIELEPSPSSEGDGDAIEGGDAAGDAEGSGDGGTGDGEGASDTAGTDPASPDGSGGEGSQDPGGDGGDG
jgi:hypothetical protein